MTTRYVRDPEGNDHWKLLLAKRGNKGDCEDFALTKRALLLEAGFPVGAVWPVICMERDVPHMVTVVSTTKADYVMDFGWHNWVYDVTDSTLKWLSAYDGQFWRLVSTTIQMDAVSDGPKLDSRS
jgi:predicted transglutaminase-like cysteine proteinase